MSPFLGRNKSLKTSLIEQYEPFSKLPSFAIALMMIQIYNNKVLSLSSVEYVYNNKFCTLTYNINMAIHFIIGRSIGFTLQILLSAK